MAKRTLESLARSYEVDDFCEYVCMTWINGNKTSAVELFKEMRAKDQAAFMNRLSSGTYNFLYDSSWHDELLHKLVYVVLPF